MIFNVQICIRAKTPEKVFPFFNLLYCSPVSICIMDQDQISRRSYFIQYGSLMILTVSSSSISSPDSL